MSDPTKLTAALDAPPSTDAEVHERIALLYGPYAIGQTGGILRDLYDLYRAQGRDVLGAWEDMLRAHLSACGDLTAKSA